MLRCGSPCGMTAPPSSPVKASPYDCVRAPGPRPLRLHLRYPRPRPLCSAPVLVPEPPPKTPLSTPGLLPALQGCARSPRPHGRLHGPAASTRRCPGVGVGLSRIWRSCTCLPDAGPGVRVGLDALGLLFPASRLFLVLSIPSLPGPGTRLIGTALYQELGLFWMLSINRGR